MSNWSDLPIEILNIIVEHLYYIDQIRVRTVCKSWRSNIYNDGKYADKLPWIMSYKRTRGYNFYNIISSNLIYLYEPSQKRRYRIETKIPTGDAKLHASKFGWLLLSEVTMSFSTHPFFFFCPFTNEVIRLPELDKMCDSFQFQATFSTAPTSSDCVIFVFQPHSDVETIRVSTCSPGDMAWSSLFFNGDMACTLQIKNVAYAKGVIYCAFHPLYVAAYNPALQEWKIHPYPPFIRRLFYQGDYRDLYLIDSPNNDKNLLLAYYSSRGLYPDFVFRFDQSQMEWFKIKNFISVSSYNEDRHERVKLETLNNRVLFRSSVQYTSLPAEGEASRLANTIHWCSSKQCSSARRSGGVRSCPQIYEWVDQQSDKEWSKVWIQPPHAHKFMTGELELELH